MVVNKEYAVCMMKNVTNRFIKDINWDDNTFTQWTVVRLNCVTG